MKYKRIGKTGLNISQIGLGTLDLGLRVSEADGIDLIKSAMNLGVNFIDTANSYPKTDRGMSEKIIGKAIQGDRHSVVIATKVYGETGEGPNDKGLSRKHIMKSVEGSLKRLGTDYIDLYFMHHPDPLVPIDETLRALDDLVRQGKVLYTGCSNFSTWQIAKMNGYAAVHDLTQLSCVEPPFNLLTRDIEIEMLPYCASEGIGVCVYSPMASELLSGKFQFGAQKEGRFADDKGYGAKTTEIYWSEINFKAVEKLKAVAKEYNLSMPQFSLAWVLSNEAITAAISGPINVEQLKENVSAAAVTLTPEALAACDDVWEMFRAPRLFYGEAGDRKTKGRWGW